MVSTTFQGKVAIVTGASRSIGWAIAIDFAKRGAQGVTITSLSDAKAAESTVADVEAAGYKRIAIQTPGTFDTTTASPVSQKTGKAFSTDGIDIQANNAGIMRIFPMGHPTPEAFHTTSTPVPGGIVVNVSSRAARIALGGQSTLCATSKAALEHMTRNVAIAHATEKRITISNATLGGIQMKIIATAPPAMIEQVKDATIAEKRLGRPGEIADVVCFNIGGDGARWINRDTISICGGAAMS